MELKDLKVKAIILPHGEYRLGAPVPVIDEGSFYHIDGTHIIDKHKINKPIKDIRSNIQALSNVMVNKYIKRLNDKELTPNNSGEYLKICNDVKRVGEHLINLIETDYIISR